MTKSLTGIGASYGKASGPAFVMRFDGDVLRVPASSVLIVRVFHPFFAPTLDRVAGLLVAEGGILQHATILAREFGVPTVVGLGSAIELIPHGTLVHLDGASGTVTF